LAEVDRSSNRGRSLSSTSAGSKIGRSDPRVLEQLMEEAKRNATRSISIRVPIADLEQARHIAEKTGVGYQTVLKQAIRDGLKRAGWRRRDVRTVNLVVLVRRKWNPRDPGP
jgi:hypothetical protein